MNQASSDAAMAELRLRLEAHQRMLARWEAKVARQLEKIVGLQKGASRTFSTESAPATPFPAIPGMKAAPDPLCSLHVIRVCMRNHAKSVRDTC